MLAHSANQAPNSLAFGSIVCNFVNQLRQAKDSANPEDPCPAEKALAATSCIAFKQPRTPAKHPIRLRLEVSVTSGSFYDPQRANDLQRQTPDLRPAGDLQRQLPRSLASRRQRQLPACASKRLRSAKIPALATQPPRSSASQTPILGLASDQNHLTAPTPRCSASRRFSAPGRQALASKRKRQLGGSYVLRKNLHQIPAQLC